MWGCRSNIGGGHRLRFVKVVVVRYVTQESGLETFRQGAGCFDDSDDGWSGSVAIMVSKWFQMDNVGNVVDRVKAP
ncbi:hypothetical protein HanHA89_Chr10g0366731 [Helianthus annuus]|nr:hypothetical protein HanHA89_Chr10g0366731 [Helianthus annuus]